MLPNVRFTVVFDGEPIIDRVITGVERRATDVSPAWPAIVAAFRTIVARAFATEGASTGTRWKPLAASTIADRKRQRFGAAPILERTGTLKRSLTTDQGLGFVQARQQVLVIGTNDPKFRYHQSKDPRRILPRRPPVLLREQDRQDITRPMVDWLTRGKSTTTPGT